MIRSPAVDFSYLRDSHSFKHFHLPRIKESPRTVTPRNLKRSRTQSATSSRLEPTDPVYTQTSQTLSKTRSRIQSHHHDQNHDLSDGVFVRGKKKETTPRDAGGVKQWLSFGGGVRNSVGVVDAFSVMKSPEEYFSIEGQSGVAVAKHLRKMDKVLIGVNGKPSPTFADRLGGRRMTENDWYDKDGVEDLLREAEKLQITTSNGESVPLCWDDQVTVPEIKTVAPKPPPPPQSPKQIPRETTAVVFHKFPTEKPSTGSRSPTLITPSKLSHQSDSSGGFRIQRRVKTFTKSSSSEAIMTIISIDQNDKLNSDSVDYDAFIDEKIPTRQFTRRVREDSPVRNSTKSASTFRPETLRHSSTFAPHPATTSPDPKLLIRPTSRSILGVQNINDEDFAVTPVRRPGKQVKPAPVSKKPTSREGANSGKLRRGKSNLGKTTPSISNNYDHSDTSYIKITEGLMSPTNGEIRHESQDKSNNATALHLIQHDSLPEAEKPDLTLNLIEKRAPDSETENDPGSPTAPAPSLNDEELSLISSRAVISTARNENFSISVSIVKRNSVEDEEEEGTTKEVDDQSITVPRVEMEESFLVESGVWAQQELLENAQYNDELGRETIVNSQETNEETETVAQETTPDSLKKCVDKETVLSEQAEAHDERIDEVNNKKESKDDNKPADPELTIEEEGSEHKEDEPVGKESQEDCTEDVKEGIGKTAEELADEAEEEEVEDVTPVIHVEVKKEKRLRFDL